MSSRQDVEEHISGKVSTATVKRQIAKGIEDGLVVSHGNNRSTVCSITPKAHLLRTVNLDSYYAKGIEERDVQTSYNFDLIRNEPPKIDMFSADEKALLALLLVSYIQPFEDGNKRTSRLVSNALLLAYGHCPLTFRSVDANDYRAALLLFYEQNNISAFKRIFIEQAEFAVHEYF